MSRRSQAAFTLVELLVALAIFAIIAGFAYRGLNTMLEGRAALEAESHKWRDVAVFVGRIERDLGAVLNGRVAIGTAGTPLMPLSSLVESTSSSEGLALSRSGSPLQANALAAPQRVAYRFRDGTVERLTWGGIDAAPRDEATIVPVFMNARSLTFRFLDPQGEWRPAWGLPGSAQLALPAAVEMTLELASGEKIVRLVDLPRSP
ncbi:MAG TPA: type II secretion system minor pseudopilin GspJ [Usitatibacter sp.]|nr:type II secretion system minor pseudopilin GspJ [Usitatibacter sp.]